MDLVVLERLALLKRNFMKWSTQLAGRVTFKKYTASKIAPKTTFVMSYLAGELNHGEDYIQSDQNKENGLESKDETSTTDNVSSDSP
jgi:hypothetical protein